MILLAVSGSTKCDWELLENKKRKSGYSSRGINPFFHQPETIQEIIEENPEPVKLKDKIKAVFFYGAGCSSKKRKSIVESALRNIFPNSNILISHDIVASAFATYEGVPAITCILGTGSNACFFDGDIVRQEVPALDYILGDEGGGSYFGKKLLKFYLYNQLPEDLAAEFIKTYKLSKDDILENVYMKPFSNVYLASFMKFLQKNKNHKFVTDLLSEGISEFLKQHVCCIPNYQEYKTHFVGSIAHYFKETIKQETKKKNIRLGKIMKEPVKGLVDYYLKYYYEKLPA